jgi:hypothetical protein
MNQNSWSKDGRFDDGNGTDVRGSRFTGIDNTIS